MIDIKEIIYLLALKTYLIDQKKHLLLDDKYTLKINTDVDCQWGYYLNHFRPIFTLYFIVTIKSNKESYQVVYMKKSRRNLETLLNSSLKDQMNFIFRRKNGLILKKMYREVNKKIMFSNKMRKAILKKASVEISELEKLNNSFIEEDITKTLKKK